MQNYCPEFDSIYTGFRINSDFPSNWLSVSWLLLENFGFLSFLEESLVVAIFTNLLNC